MTPRVPAASGVLVALLLASGCAIPRPARPTRVVLVTIDTLRADSLLASPPALALASRRASRGVVFASFYAATSTTQPSHASLFTGLPPWRHGITRNGQVLADSHRTVAEAFRDAGFETAAVVGAFPVSARFGFGQGFGAYDETFDRATAPNRMWGAEAAEARFYRLGEAVTTAALARLDALASARQFLWVHYFDPHSPYGDAAGGSWMRPHEVLEAARAGGDAAAQVSRARGLYYADVRALDRSLDRLLERLERDGRTFDTHVLVVADHGESFGEDGSMGHGKRLTRGQVQVPCFILSPKARPGGRNDVAGSVDVATTLLGLAGLDGRAFGGRDLLGTRPASTAAFGMRRTFARPHDDLRLDGRLHRLDFDLFYAVGEDGRLYAGNAQGLRDGGPDVPPASPEVERRLRALFRSFEGELRGAPAARLDPEAEEALRALGYVG